MPRQVEVTRWSGRESPTEATLRQLLAAQGLRPYRWANGPGDDYAAHQHTYHKVIYVVQGEIVFEFPEENRTLRLRAGDRLDLPAETRHAAVVGPQGVVCLEAHL